MEGVSPMPSSVAPINEGLRQIVKSRHFWHYNDKNLREHIEACRAVETSNGIMLQPVAPGHPIDGAAALALATKDIYKGQQQVIRIHRAKKSPTPPPTVPTSSSWVFHQPGGMGARFHQPRPVGTGKRISDLISDASK